MEEEVRDHREMRQVEDVSAGGMGTESLILICDSGLEADIPELHGQKIDPVSFDRYHPRHKCALGAERKAADRMW